MVSSNELRIGNIVLYAPTNTHITVGYHHIRLLSISAEPYPQYEPIQLTEEILLKCRFVGNEDEMHIVLGLGSGEELSIEFITDTACLTRSQPKCNRNDTLDFCYIKYPKYLHQLQNLYFALTGKELEINL